MATHAPYAILGEIVLAYGKTIKTACGKRVAVTRTIDRDTTDCPDCQRAIAEDRQRSQDMMRIAHELGWDGS